MWISSFAIRNPVITIVVVLALVVFGALALVFLETDEFPEVNPPVIAVSVPYPGASPQEVESELVEPLEEAFESISGVDKITSTATDGFANIIVTFVFQKDLQLASQDIRDKISETRRDLPPEIEEPVLTRFDPNLLPIVSVTLSSTRLSAAELTRLADPGLAGELRAIPGVAEVDIIGGRERQLEVQLDPSAMQAAGVGVDEVVRALRAQNLAAPVGQVKTRYQERSLRLRGRIEAPADFERVVITSFGPRKVELGDVAHIKDGAEEPRTAAFIDGEKAVGLDIVKSTGYSTTAVSERIRARIAELRRQLPAETQLRIVRDAGVRVDNSVASVQQSLLEGALLTVLVVFIFLASWRSTIITGLALPVSVLASFIAVWLFGFTLNTMSLLGLSLAIGILIDDAIVVRENIVRHMEMGKDHIRAAHEGTAEIGLAVAATTFAIIVVFVPVAFMGGIAEQWFAPFALTIASSVLVSLFVSFSLDPMLSAAWADPEVEGGAKSGLTRWLARFNKWLERQTGRYQRVVAWALRHRLAMVLIALASFGVALAMPAVGLVGSEFFPREDRSEFTIHIETPPGSSLDYTTRKAERIATLARERPEVAYTYTTVGGAESGRVDIADVYVRLVPRSQRNLSQQVIADSLRQAARRIAGTEVSLATSGFGAEKQIQVQLTGPDLAVLGELAARIAAEVRQVRGAADVGLSTRGNQPELEVRVDRGLAGTLGVDVDQVGQSLRAAFAGVEAGNWIDPQGETRDVEVRLAPEFRTSAADIGRLPLVVRRPTGEIVVLPLAQVAAVRRGLGPTQIDHLKGHRVITIGANTENRPLSEVVSGIQARLANVPLPRGYNITQGGETEDQVEVFGRILTALAVAALLMYFILVAQFRSFLDPVPILASLPLSLIGVMLALLFWGSTLNIMSMIGVILLAGIVAKNAILLIDFAKWAERDGLSRHQAIIAAGGVRLRPILMTSVAIIAGMTPVALGIGEGGDFRAPLGRAVIGGVVTSTLLTLLVIPTFYDILAGWRARLIRAARRPTGRAPRRADEERQAAE